MRLAAKQGRSQLEWSILDVEQQEWDRQVAGPDVAAAANGEQGMALAVAQPPVPAILGGAPAEHWVTRFTPPPVEDAPVEQMIHQE